MIVGHTAPGELPRPVVGYAGPFSVGQLGRDRKHWAIFATAHYAKEFAPRIKDYPHRSAEYVFAAKDPTGGRLDAIALLDAGTAPAFELGLTYAATNEAPRLRYSADPIRADEESSPDMDAPVDNPPPAASPDAPPAADPAMVAAVQAAILPAVKQVVMEVLQAAGVAVPAADPSPEGAPSSPPAQSGGAPEGSPAGDDPNEKKANYSDVQTIRLRYEREIAERRKVEDRLAEAETRLASVEQEKRQTARYAAIAQLRADGYVVSDDETEYAAMAKFDDASFPAMIEQRRLYGAKVPRGSLPIPASPKLDPEPTPEARVAKTTKAAALARTKGISLAEALLQIG